MKLEYPKIITELKHHPRKIITEAENVKNKVEKWLLYDEAPKREEVEWVTIDKETSRILDDWISAEKTKFWYSIFISIADIAEIIRPWTELDFYALSKVFSVYLQTHAHHIFPEHVSIDICSLKDQTKKLTITTRVDIDKDFNIIDSTTFESIFYNKKRLDYENFNKHFSNHWEKLHDELHLFYDIAKGLYKNKISRWASPDFEEHIWLKINKPEINSTSVARFIVKEFMGAANIENARKFYKEKINWIFKLYMPEQKWNIIPSPQVSRAFYNYIPWYHHWLWENFYANTTSPIIRYPDLINIRQIKASIRKDIPVYNINETRKLSIHFNSTRESLVKLERQHIKIADDKRIERLLKKMEINNFSTITSIPENIFDKLMNYFTNNPSYLNIENIRNEILYRIEHELFSSRIIWKIIWIPKIIKGANIFKEKIKEKEEQN